VIVESGSHRIAAAPSKCMRRFPRNLPLTDALAGNIHTYT
jgi:hypothetical protein